MKKLLIAACAVTLVFAACKDDKDDATPSNSQTGGTLTGIDWRMTANSMTITGAGPFDGTTDMYAEMEDCEKDNLSRFNEDKTMVEKEGATKCDASDPDVKSTATWELLSNNTKLKVTPTGGDELVFDIITLNANTLTVKMTETDAGATSTITTTFTKN